jgi:hypothetical protein
MYAIIINQHRHWSPEQAKAKLDSFKQYGFGSGFAGAMMHPDSTTLSVYRYEQVDHLDFDQMFATQMAAKDKLIAMPGSGKGGADLLGASMVMPDYDDDYPEDY